MTVLTQEQLITEFPVITGNSVILGDCSKVLKHISDQSVSLLLTDPPYATTNAEWDKTLEWDKIWAEIKRILKPNGTVCLTATQPFAADLIASNRAWFRYDLIWQKNKSTGHLNANKMPMRSHETILVFYDELPIYNPQMTVGHEPLHYAVNRGKTQLYGEFNSVESRTGATNRYPKSVLNFDVVNNTDRIHPTQKPVDLFCYLIKTYTNEGETVLDLAAGSMTTGVSAKITNRSYICIENDSKYFNAGVARLRSCIL